MFRLTPGSRLLTAAVLIAFSGLAASAKTAKVTKKHGHRAAHHEPIGQRGIDTQRATEIQKALIRENYLTGEPSGQWDGQTEAAMQKFQADHGWQTKLTPDSRALIKLGLGPNTASGPQALPANTYSNPSQAAEAGTLASVHSITQ